MIRFKHSGNFKHAEAFFDRATAKSHLAVLEKYGQVGVNALASATPKDSGSTAESWDYEIEEGKNSDKIYWTNSNENDGVNVAVLLQYGHGTGTGGYVPGTDYINPAMKPIFDQIADETWKEVTAK